LTCVSAATVDLEWGLEEEGMPFPVVGDGEKGPLVEGASVVTVVTGGSFTRGVPGGDIAG
jgi:hypothetical protein